ncbi:helix-turn-helix transcriptional regulator [uncultured Olegusella sp.]|uniref:helix-turn-helix domain-containing protein n=1 Tax=uncultured Olegusella sp. TaxID=1979846 RepID=UPI0026018C87|nr:helix-turn-helix domain-containing protein [uncultured Olegusella sp.]
MGKNTPFKCAFDGLSPLLKDKAKSGEFVASIINMGLKPEVKFKDGNFVEHSALKIVAVSTWKSYANGNREISQAVASELAGRWKSNRFEQNLQDTYEEPALNDCSVLLQRIDPQINRGNIGYQLGELFYNIFKTAGGDPNAVLPPEIENIVRLEREGEPFIHTVTHDLHLDEQRIKLKSQQETREAIVRICEALDCQPGDVVEAIALSDAREKEKA